MRQICFAAIIAAIALTGPSLAQNRPGSLPGGEIKLAAANSDQVEARAVMLDKRQRGALMDFELRVEFDHVPQSKVYQFYIYDAGMKRDGLPPAPVPNASHRFKPDNQGHLEFGFVLNGFSKGEWVQCTLKSTDHSIQKSIRFVPFK